MNLTLLTYGSRGDVQPFLALALGLRRAGHAVTLAAPLRFAAWIESRGVTCAPLPGDPEEISRRLNDAGTNPFAQVQAISGYIFSIAGEVARAAFAACEGADCIVHSFLFTVGGHSLARQRGIPDVSAQTFPMFAPTRAFPNVAAASLPPGPLSYFSHWLSSQIFWRGGNLGYRSLRRAAPELGNLTLFWPFQAENPRPTPLLFAFSPLVVPHPPEWNPARIHIPGYFFLDEEPGYEPPAQLAEFLAAGPPPVCVTFGSMLNRKTAQTYAAVTQALARKGQRAVVLTGWGGGASQDKPDLLHLESIPHAWLLPRCAAVIHHGGAGTTAAGLRAGIPALVIPHAGDQPFWGKRVAALGAGPRPLSLGKLQPARLDAALEELGGPDMGRRAAEIGAAIRTEDGVAEAVRIIENCRLG